MANLAPSLPELQSMTLQELKERLLLFGVKVSGNKGNLVNQLSRFYDYIMPIAFDGIGTAPIDLMGRSVYSYDVGRNGNLLLHAGETFEFLPRVSTDTAGVAVSTRILKALNKKKAPLIVTDMTIAISRSTITTPHENKDGFITSVAYHRVVGLKFKGWKEFAYIRAQDRVEHNPNGNCYHDVVVREISNDETLDCE